LENHFDIRKLAWRLPNKLSQGLRLLGSRGTFLKSQEKSKGTGTWLPTLLFSWFSDPFDFRRSHLRVFRLCRNLYSASIPGRAKPLKGLVHPGKRPSSIEWGIRRMPISSHSIS